MEAGDGSSSSISEDGLVPGTLECVVFMLIRNGEVLAEKRSPGDRIDPGRVALPGGHVEKGETPTAALRRELWEELGVVPGSLRWICSLWHQGLEVQRVHFFAIETWTGTIVSKEAERLLWIPMAEAGRLDLQGDRVAVSEYLRYAAGRTPEEVS